MVGSPHTRDGTSREGRALKTHVFKTLGLAFLFITIAAPDEVSAGTAPNLPPAKQKADAKGYVIISSHDEIVAKAKKEGKVRVSASMQPSTIKSTTAAFKKKYPFIDTYVEEVKGPDSAQRQLLEIQGGASRKWDVIYVAAHFRSGYNPYLWNADLLAMSKHGVLQIPPLMVDPKYRNVVVFDTNFQATVYNAKLFPPELVPKTYEDLLRPELKGKKFAIDIRPKDIAGLVPAWGLEKTLDFARKIAAQQPIWVRGASRALASMMAGEISLLVGPNVGSILNAQSKDRAGVLQYVVPEPVPVRFVNPQGVLASAQNPYAALLWLEWLASPEAQKITDEHEGLSSSLYVPGGGVEQALRGKKLSVVDWEHLHRVEEWEGEVFKVYGFPKVQ
jgi:ABC-type Fe3+ transport system substrate-binding protein